MPYRLKKWVNARRNESEFRSRRVVLESHPPIVFIDPTNVCNLHCALCPTGQGKIPPPHGTMPLELFKRVAAALGPTARQLHLYNWGEPLLHAGIIEMIRFAAQFGARTYVSSNLMILTDGVAEGLAESGLDVLNTSIDGVTQESYAAYRQGGELAKVLANLRRLADARRRARRSRLRIRWQFMVNRQNQGEIDQARAMARDIGVDFRVKRIRVGLAEFDTRSAAEVAEQDDKWLPADEDLNRYKAGRNKRPTACRQLWDHTVVNFNGSISPCCQVYDPAQWFAKGFPESFDAVWNGPEYTAARRMFATGEVTNEARRLVCHRCMELGNVL